MGRLNLSPADLAVDVLGPVPFEVIHGGKVEEYGRAVMEKMDAQIVASLGVPSALLGGDCKYSGAVHPAGTVGAGSLRTASPAIGFVGGQRNGPEPVGNHRQKTSPSVSQGSKAMGVNGMPPKGQKPAPSPPPPPKKTFGERLKELAKKRGAVKVKGGPLYKMFTDESKFKVAVKKIIDDIAALDAWGKSLVGNPAMGNPATFKMEFEAEFVEDPEALSLFGKAIHAVNSLPMVHPPAIIAADTVGPSTSPPPKPQPEVKGVIAGERLISLE